MPVRPPTSPPNQLLAVWPYLDFQDPRWRFGSKFITLRQDPGRGPTKLGLAHKLGSVGYLNAGTLFVKWFEYRAGQIYPDDGVNLETFTNEDMLEIETLGPLITLDPGESVEHTERWELFGGLGHPGRRRGDRGEHRPSPGREVGRARGNPRGSGRGPRRPGHEARRPPVGGHQPQGLHSSAKYILSFGGQVLRSNIRPR